MEVELGPRAVEDEGGPVVGPCRVLGGGESAEPLTRALAGLADLGDPLAPAALADAAVAELAVVGPPFALALLAAAAWAAVAVAVAIVWAVVWAGGGLFYWVIHFWEEKRAAEIERRGLW